MIHIIDIKTHNLRVNCFIKMSSSNLILSPQEKYFKVQTKHPQNTRIFVNSHIHENNEIRILRIFVFFFPLSTESI